MKAKTRLRDGDYAVEELPNLQQQAWGFYEKPSGDVVRLPCDSRSFKIYTAKGFKFQKHWEGTP